MGNAIAIDSEDFEDYLSDDDSSSDDINVSEQYRIAYSMLASIMRQEVPPPVIRKRPDLRVFRHTMMYKEIKALSGYPANSKKPNESLCLARGLMKRENGLSICKHGSFSSNQQRRIANFFVPNKRCDRLLSLDTKLYISRFSKDGSLLLTISQDGTVRLFDAVNGTYQRTKRIRLRDINWSVLDADFSPCLRYFTYSTWEDAFHVIPLDGDETNYQSYDIGADRDRAGMFSVRFSPCDGGRTIIGGCTDSKIVICDRETRQISSIRTQNACVDVNAVSFISNQDPNLIVSGCHNGLVKLWDLRCSIGHRTAKASSVFLGHFDGITFIDPRNDGHYLLTNSKDQSIKIWDLRQPSPSSKVNSHPNIPLIDWDYRHAQVPREYYNPTKVLDGDVSVMTFRGHRVSKTLLRARFSPAIQTGHRYIYTGCSTGRIIIYDVLTGQIKETIESHRYVIRDLHWHPVRAEIVSGSFDCQVNLNMYRNNPNLKRPRPVKVKKKPLRRSRRIAKRKGELDVDDEDEDDENEF